MSKALTVIKNQPTNYEPGIFFNLSNECYHLDGALSNSGIKLVRESGLEYWWNNKLFNKHFAYIEKKRSAAMEESDLFHRMLLEPERFYREYQVIPAEVPDYNKKGIGKIQHDKIALAIQILRSNPILNRLFTGGVAEVSFFCRDPETGVMLRARPDYLKPGVIVDYKAHRRVDDYGMTQDLVTYGYDQQAGLYKWVIEEVKRLIARGKAGVFTAVESGQYRDGFDNPAHEKWFAEFMAADVESYPFVYAFQKKEPPFICRPIELYADALELGLQKAREGIADYKAYFEEFGFKPWPDKKTTIRGVGLDDLSNRIFHT